VIVLSVEDRDRLESTCRRLTAAVRDVQRARIVLAAADGLENVEIAEVVGVDVNTASKWRKRFFDEGIDGLMDRYRSGRPRAFPPSGGRRDQRTRLRTPGDDGGAAVTLVVQ
jgi:Winged helix-turn helix